MDLEKIVKQELEELRFTPEDENRLSELEKIVSEGMRTFYRVGMALKEIKERRLYLIKYKTLEEYSEQVLKIKKAHVYRLMSAAETAERLETFQKKNAESYRESPLGDKTSPKGDSKNTLYETHIRPLTKLDPDTQEKAWQKAQEIAAERGCRINANIVREAVRQVTGRSKLPEPAVSKVDHQSDAFRAAVSKFKNAVLREREKNWSETTVDAVRFEVKLILELTRWK